MNLIEILEARNYSLVDVRELTELENDGNFPNAIHIPLAEIPNEIETIKNLAKPTIIFCRSGNRSGKAIDFLESEGLEGLINGGGYNDLINYIGE